MEIPSRSFHGSFRGTRFTSIGFRELPSVVIYFHNLHSVSGSFHCFHGSFHCFHRIFYLRLPLLPLELVFASIEASRSLHRFRGSFHLQRNPLPCAMGASVEAAETSMEAVESFHFLSEWKPPRILPVEASSSTCAEASKELRSLPRASIWFHLLPLTSDSSHEL